MGIFSIVLIAVGLSMDSFAVSVSNGLTIPRIRFVQGVVIAFFLAFFQTLMPWLGWVAGRELRSLIMAADHWIAFILLSLIGMKMILEGRRPPGGKLMERINFITLAGQSVATSIDALVVGITFAYMEISIVMALAVIGGITFLASMSGSFLGKTYSEKVKFKPEIAGGIILIALGTKILIEHLFFGG